MHKILVNFYTNNLCKISVTSIFPVTSTCIKELLTPFDIWRGGRMETIANPPSYFCYFAAAPPNIVLFCGRPLHIFLSFNPTNPPPTLFIPGTHMRTPLPEYLF